MGSGMGTFFLAHSLPFLHTLFLLFLFFGAFERVLRGWIGKGDVFWCGFERKRGCVWLLMVL